MKSLFRASLLVAALLLAAPLAFGQNKLDYWLKDVIATHRENPKSLPHQQQRGVLAERMDGSAAVSVILQSHNGDFSFVPHRGGRLRTVIGPYATAILPVAALEEIAARPEIAYVAGTLQLAPLNNLSTQATGASAARAAGYTGEEVLIGVVDSGIDVKHPGFRNQDGTRILFLWDQTAAGSGPQEPFYDYGSEWTKTQIDQGLCTEKDTDGHGTHVAGSIAQHLTTGPDSAYSGSVPAANLIIVKTTYASAAILDGIYYVFEKARQLGKPAIVNLSLGSQRGPHDGRDPFTAAQDYLSGPGRIIVQSAGNDGDNPIHAMVTADGNGEDMSFSLQSTAPVVEFELWHAGNQNVSIQIFAPGGLSSNPVPSGAWGTIPFPGMPVVVDNARNGPEFYNNDKRISITLQNAAAGTWRFRLASVTPTIVHAWMWHAEPEAEFKFATSDNSYTLVNEACGRNNIVVGATVIRNRFRVRDVPGIPDGTELFTGEVIGELASFTSSGPTRDGREKPDIVAPGTMIASALSGDIEATPAATPEEFRSIGPRYPAHGLQHQQFMQGTSMSGPIAAGGIAQALKRRWQTTAAMLKAYFERYSQAVGTIAAGVWHPRAGRGMINMQALVDNQIRVTALSQQAGARLVLTFNKPPSSSAANPNNYRLVGASAARSIVRADLTGETVMLTADGDLVEGERDELHIENVSAIAGLESFAEPLRIEIDKLGTQVPPRYVLTNEIWRPEDSPYYIHGRVQIPSFVKLKIEPGTVIKFMPNAADSSGLEVFGGLEAQGTADQPIVFTSLQAARNGEWAGISFGRDIPATLLRHCVIRHAETGILCRSSRLTLEDCRIEHTYEAGFLALDCSPQLKRIVIWDANGGEFDDGIQLQNATAATVIENVTIHGNGRGGIVCFASSPRIVNSIISNNSGPGIHSQDGGTVTVTYSDSWGNNPNFSNVARGTGTLELNPRYVNAGAGDFHLLPDSPCIDTGDPAFAKDPDGSRSDMGAVYFDSRPLDVANVTATAGNRQVELTWSDPVDARFAGLLILRSLGDSVASSLQHGVAYEVNSQIGNAVVIYKSTAVPSSGRYVDTGLTNGTPHFYKMFAFSRVPSYAGGVAVAATPSEPSAVAAQADGLPTAFALRQNYPNPFNPLTTIAYDLPQPAEVRLGVYDLQGHLIRRLLAARQPAGFHQVVWDVRNNSNFSMPSGVYVIRLHAGDFEKSIRAVLVK